MHFETSPSTSPSPSKAIPIRSMSSSTSSTSSLDSFFGFPRFSSSGQGSACAFPSWPTGSSLGSFTKSSNPSSYISDEDLYPEDVFGSGSDFSGVPFLAEAPAPPRQPTQAFPLMPLYALEKPKKQRRRSSRKARSPAKPMPAIVESPETPSE